MRSLSATLLAVLSSATVAISQSAPQLRPREVVSGAAATRVDDYLSRLVRHGFSGAVLIAKDGQIVLKRAYGMANRETGLPYDVGMVSCIGSVTKQFTGAAIMKLEMQGKLSTSDPISKYLPGVPADKAGITIHHLLTHTAGFSGDLGGSDEEPIARDALVAKVLAAPLVAKPGAQFEYSNEGFALAAAIVERVSGQGYEAFLRAQLFLPAGMTDTGYQTPAWPIERLPIGYGMDGAAWGRTYQEWMAAGRTGLVSARQRRDSLVARRSLPLAPGARNAERALRRRAEEVPHRLRADAHRREVRLRLGRADVEARHDGDRAQRRQRVSLYGLQALHRRARRHHRDDERAGDSGAAVGAARDRVAVLWRPAGRDAARAR